jgi:plasmid stability protein
MPTVILENVPPEVYERLRQRASACHHSVADEFMSLVRKALQTEPAT